MRLHIRNYCIRVYFNFVTCVTALLFLHPRGKSLESCVSASNSMVEDSTPGCVFPTSVLAHPRYVEHLERLVRELTEELRASAKHESSTASTCAFAPFCFPPHRALCLCSMEACRKVYMILGNQTESLVAEHIGAQI